MQTHFSMHMGPHTIVPPPHSLKKKKKTHSSEVCLGSVETCELYRFGLETELNITQEAIWFRLRWISDGIMGFVLNQPISDEQHMKHSVRTN